MLTVVEKLLEYFMFIDKYLNSSNIKWLSPEEKYLNDVSIYLHA